MSIKKKEKNISTFQDLIKIREQELVKDPKNINFQTEFKILQEQLQNILIEEIRKNIRLLSQRYFEGADNI